MAEVFNEGVGHGAFVATLSVAGSVILENFNVEKPEAHGIMQSNQIGSPLKSASVSGFQSATCTAQLNVVAGVAQLIAQGETFTAPTTHGGGRYYIYAIGETYQVGEYWKANLQCRKRYNPE